MSKGIIATISTLITMLALGVTIATVYSYPTLKGTDERYNTSIERSIDELENIEKEVKEAFKLSNYDIISYKELKQEPIIEILEKYRMYLQGEEENGSVNEELEFTPVFGVNQSNREVLDLYIPLSDSTFEAIIMIKLLNGEVVSADVR